MSKREAQLYISDIINSAKKILDYVVGMSFDDFAKDERTFDAVIRNLEIFVGDRHACRLRR